MVPAASRRLLAVADALDQAGGPQHVVGHALAPLAPRLGVGERLAQRLRGVGQPGADRRHLGEAGLDPAVLLGPLALQRGHQLGDPVQLGPHVAHVLLDRGGPQGHLVGERAAQLADRAGRSVLARRELAGARLGLGAEPVARHLDDRVDGGVDRGPHGRLVLGRPPLLVGPAGLALGRTARAQPCRQQPRARGADHHAESEAGDHDEDEQCGVHGANPKDGV